MKILEIKKYPDKVLRTKCKTLEKITENEIRLFEDMLFTLRQAQGLGLAAPQVGISKQLIVADIGEGPLRLANPQLIWASAKSKAEEGCLSLPGALVNIERADEIGIKGLNEKGELAEIKAKGLLARVILHEIDHLNGKLIIDYMNLLAKLKYQLGIKSERENASRRSKC